jgi:hypothetical protein
MHQPTRLSHCFNVLKVSLISVFLACSPATILAQDDGDNGQSPDGLWQVLDTVEFPERYPVPEQYIPLSLDEDLLGELLNGIPRETFGQFPSNTLLWLPLAGGGFAEAAFAQSQLMEAALASQFPEIMTMVFHSPPLAGHVALGPKGFVLAAQTPDGFWRVEPVETAMGRVYLSYFDADRTDGLGALIHDPAMGDGSEPPPVPRVAPSSLQDDGHNHVHKSGPAINLTQGIVAGDQLRIYRLAAATTGEFYQARDTGNGLIDVVFSLAADLAGANAVFEPEVSVRLILAAASLSIIYSDPDTDPFDNDNRTACELREDNQANTTAVVADADYDLGFLFAARAGGGANGCAWFVVCQDGDKARGAGLMGGNGTNSASGLLAHEVGHQLGARHTFTGQAGSCTLNEFQAGNSESGYEPGSGTTRMSYNGNCDEDNVDVDTGNGAVGAGSYFHSRSFDEIVDNVFSGDGSNCGTLVNTSNLPPAVDAGADYTIPRGTPFMLTGSAMDDEPLVYNWEQYDRALTQRPINTDPGDGPIIRSIPPGTDPTRIVPNLQDLLDGVVRNGEILPETDRELNFRFIARDNLMGGGGEAYDEMVITVAGDPFFIQSPNSGSFDAACEVPLAWQVGGGSVADQVQAYFSSDGGQSFPTALTAAVDNDGADSFIMPCELTATGRIKLQSVGNIFFDINDHNLTVFNSPPVVDVSTAGGEVDDNCEFTVNFEATATDACGLLAADVEVEFFKQMENFTLGSPTVNINQVNANEVSVDGSVLISDLTSSPARLAVSVTATDACGADTNNYAEAVVEDTTPPEIDVSVEPDTLWPPNHKMADITATVIATDNCPGTSFVLSSIISSEPDNGLGDGDTAGDIDGADLGTADLEFRLRKERSGLNDGRDYTIIYAAEDGSGNTTEDSAVVRVPHNKKDKL